MTIQNTQQNKQISYSYESTHNNLYIEERKTLRLDTGSLIYSKHDKSKINKKGVTISIDH